MLQRALISVACHRVLIAHRLFGVLPVGIQVLLILPVLIAVLCWGVHTARRLFRFLLVDLLVFKVSFLGSRPPHHVVLSAETLVI